MNIDDIFDKRARENVGFLTHHLATHTNAADANWGMLLTGINQDPRTWDTVDLSFALVRITEALGIALDSFDSIAPDFQDEDGQSLRDIIAEFCAPRDENGNSTIPRSFPDLLEDDDDAP